MNFVTVPVRKNAIDKAVLQGLNDLSIEIGGGLVELVNVIPVVIPGLFSKRVYITIMARPYVVPASIEEKGQSDG